MKKKKIIFFLDRDGTIIKHIHYLNSIKQVQIYKSTIKSLKILRKFGKIYLITNQSAVARGILKEKNLKDINEYIIKKINKNEKLIEKFFYCPHHIEGSVKIYKKDCSYRKPNTGFLKKIYKKHQFDKKNSWFIGDTYSDIKTANNFKINSVLLKTGERLKKNEHNATPNYVSNNLYNATKKILKNLK